MGRVRAGLWAELQGWHEELATRQPPGAVLVESQEQRTGTCCLLPGDLKPAIHSVTGDKTDGTFGLRSWVGVAALTMYSMLEAGGYTWPRSLL